MRGRSATIRNAFARVGARVASRSSGLRAALGLAACFAASFALHAQSGSGTGYISTVFGPNPPVASGSAVPIEPMDVAFDAAGNLYTTDIANCVVWKTTFSGGVPVSTTVFAGEPGQCTPATSPTQSSPTANVLTAPWSVAVCGTSVFIATHGVDAIANGQSQATSVAGNVYEVDLSDGSPGTFSVLGLAPTNAPGGPLFPIALACALDSNQVMHLWLSAYLYGPLVDGLTPVDEELIEYSPQGSGWTSAWTGIGNTSILYTSLAVDPLNGTLYGTSSYADGIPGWNGPDFWPPGFIYPLVDTATQLPTGTSASDPDKYLNLSGLAVDGQGNFIISGLPQTSSSGVPAQVAFTPNGGANSGQTTILAGNGTAGYLDDAIATSGELNYPQGVAVDGSGDIFVADAKNNRVREIRNLSAGPQGLNLVLPALSQSATTGYQQSAIDTGTDDFFYLSAANAISVINVDALSDNYERVVATIQLGPATQGGPSPTMIVDSNQHLLYALRNGTLYSIDADPASSTAFQVVGSVALNDPNQYLLAIDPTFASGQSRVYAAGPSSATISVVQGGRSPELLQSIGSPAGLAASLAVDTNRHLVYSVAAPFVLGEGTQEMLTVMTPDPATGEFSASTVPYPLDEDVLAPAFIGNSLAADTTTGSLIASGAASLDTTFHQTNYAAQDFFEAPDFTTWAPATTGVSPINAFPPITTVLDPVNRAFYVTDFDGSPFDTSANAVMVAGMDEVQPPTSGPLKLTCIPVFPAAVGQATQTVPCPAAPSPHVYDVEPDIGSDQAWISASDATDGGFVELWNGLTQTISQTPGLLVIPNNGGGHLSVDNARQAAWLLDNVNGLLYAINEPQWTPTPAPTMTLAGGGASVTIQAAVAGDFVFYTLNGAQPTAASTPCGETAGGVASCSVPLTPGQTTLINAIEVAGVVAPIASNMVQQTFFEKTPTSVAVGITPGSVASGSGATATATITPTSGVSSVSGTVSFTETLAGSGTPIQLCSSAGVTNSAGTFQATCNFAAPAATGSYTMTAAYSGDTYNLAGNGSGTFTVTAATSGGGGSPSSFNLLGATNAMAINRNDSGTPYNAVLNNDSSVNLLQDGQLLAAGCPAYTALNLGGFPLSGGDINLQSTSGGLTIYLSLLANGQIYFTYESIDLTTYVCTQGPVSAPPNLITTDEAPTVEVNVDAAEGNFYALLASGGGATDLLLVMPIAPWNGPYYIQSCDCDEPVPWPNQYNLDNGAAYGPIVIDASSHLVYMNDLGTPETYKVAGETGTNGFFVFYPASSPGSSLIQQVVGYYQTSGGSTTAINAEALFSNNNGELVLVNENPVIPLTQLNPLSTPVTLINTSAPGFSFFSNTVPSSGNGVYIAASGAITNVAAKSTYMGLSGADLDPQNNIAYVYAYTAWPATGPGLLLAYNLTAGTETVLNNSVSEPSGAPGYPSSWTELDYDPLSTTLTLNGSNLNLTDASVGDLETTSGICSGPPLSLNALESPGGNGADPTNGPFSINSVTGFEYTVVGQQNIGVIPGAAGCSTAGGGLQVLSTALPAAVAGQSYPAQTLSASGGTPPYQWTTPAMPGNLNLSPAGIVSGTPSTSNPAASFAVTVEDSTGKTGQGTIALPIDPALAISPGSLADGGVGTAYSATLIANGGSGSNYSWSISYSTTSPTLTELGLSFSGASSGTASITGTPGSAGTAVFTVTLTNQISSSISYTTAQTYTLVVNPGNSTAYVSDQEDILVSDQVSADAASVAGSSDNETVTVTDTANVTASGAGIAQVGDQETIVVSDEAVSGTSGGLVTVQENETILVSDGSPSVTAETDFSMNFAGPPRLSLYPGQSATLSLTVKPIDGAFNQPVEFSITGLPSGATALFNPSSVTPGNQTQAASLTITVAPLTAQTPPAGGTRRMAFIFALVLPILGLCGAPRRLRRTSLLTLAGIFSLVLAAGAMGCGASGFFNQPPRAYIVTVTGTAGVISHSTTFQLTVE